MVEEVKNEYEFKEQLSRNKYVLVDFWAPWCGPCRTIAPILEEVSARYKEKVKVIKVNVDDNSDLAEKFNIMSIPTLIFFENGQPKDKVIGALPLNALSSFIDRNINQ